MPAKKLPTWFNEHTRPYPYIGVEPKEFHTIRRDVSRVEISVEQPLPIEPGKKYYIDADYGYDGVPPDLYLVEFEEVEVKNIHYVSQLNYYNQQLEMNKEWEEIMKTLPALKASKKEREERALYRKLKKKYEKS